jgi:hypothetical protein
LGCARKACYRKNERRLSLIRLMRMDRPVKISEHEVGAYLRDFRYATYGDRFRKPPLYLAKEKPQLTAMTGSLKGEYF